MFVCPDCKSPLVNGACNSCKVQFANTGSNIPLLLSRDPKLQSVQNISAVYDDIYSNRSSVWEDQGRTPEFMEFFSKLTAQLSTGRLLEIGCGEGFLLSNLKASSKFAVEISPEALQKAKERTRAECAVALAERLPFPPESFDIVVSVGVMEHFLDDAAASREIVRVLRPGGHYVALIHVPLSSSGRYAQKFREYLYPRFRPIAFTRWLKSKFIKPIHQPIQRGYTPESAQACLKQAGLTVDRVISQHNTPSAPLVGPHVYIYVTHK